MRISRHFLDQELEADQQLTLDGPVAHHLARVLRAKPGQLLVLFNNSGAEFDAEVLAVHSGELQLSIRGQRKPAVESSLQTSLAQAIGKGERMDYSLQKATELGVTSIQPLFTERTEVRLQGKRLDKRQQHWQGVLISAAEQSGRVRVPHLNRALSLRDWLATRSGKDSEILLLHPEAGQSLVDWAQAETHQNCAVCIGPEGGFSDAELNGLSAAGATSLTLGPRILRTETAGPAALAVLQAILGDWGQ